MVDSQPHHMMGIWPIHVIHSHSNTPVQKSESPHRLADTVRASTGVFAVGLGPNCRSHHDCATLKSMASAREPLSVFIPDHRGRLRISFYVSRNHHIKVFSSHGLSTD